MRTDIAKIFSSQGPLAALDPAYEERPQQVAMAEAVAEALGAGRRLAVEAGTGVGKSLAYLLPGALWTLAEDRRLMVSTYTRALQEQLMHRDLPMAAAVLRAMGSGLDFACLMGSDNYLCLRRLFLQRRSPDLFDRRSEAVLVGLSAWVGKAPTGYRSALPVLVPEGLWLRLCRDPDACMGSACRYREDCLYRRDWARAESSRVLVVNHALLLSSPRLPAYGALVIDEAHSLEDAAASHYGVTVSDARCGRVLSDIASSDGRRGLLSRLRGVREGDRRVVEDLVEGCRKEVWRFFGDLAQAHGLEFPARAAGSRVHEEPRSRRLERDHGLKGISGLKGLEAALGGIEGACSDPEEVVELKSVVLRLAKLRHDFDAALKTGEAAVAVSGLPTSDHFLADPLRGPEPASGRFGGSVARWVESGKGRIGLHLAPLDLAPRLERDLFAKEIPIVMTSATLSAGRGLKEFKSRVGAGGAAELVLDSPFDYPTQAGLLLVDELPEPRKEGPYAEAVADACRRIIAAVPGGLFILFSSWRMLESVAKMLRRKVKGRPLWTQGETGNEALLENFMAARNAVLLGVDTFWQGVDVHGGALSCVVLAKLPFPNFATPIEESRREYLESRGLSYFEDHSVPKAVVKFRQGFGRLIRSCEDRGAVVVLDPRILHRRYGKTFLDALPRCRKLSSIEELEGFFRDGR
ncbi:MAG: ATP-dependent DNA helicase [Elusimicrobia bacterium]|nr:ATP-dependent DNA helicase [Elusimicrobiota bacterium]